MLKLDCRGSALAKAGPGSLLIAYAFVGLIVYVVMCALGEMATWIPLSSGFTGYATRFVDPALGLATGYTYWFKYIIGAGFRVFKASRRI